MYPLVCYLGWERGFFVYLALYRKWRPQTFSDVRGQDHITAVLKSQAAGGRISHAYLFCGSRGTGKTTTAKILAKAANCLDLQDGDPCNRCESCRAIDAGSTPDVLEIDAASNNSVENIRDLREEVVYPPSMLKKRVYIIDEVHMLSTSAFNALLKILEEPPEHVIFILATTEIQKVLPTIISRCQRFDFQRIESEIIARRLAEVAGREGFSLDGDAASLIARLSDGGMRDALSLLDVCAANTDAVTVETVAAAAGLAGSAHLMELTGRILAGDTQGMLEALSALIQKGMEPQRLAEQLAAHYRNLMLAKTLEHPERLLDCLPTEIETLRAQAGEIALPDLLQSITALQDAAARMSRSTAKRAELELALVTLCEPAVRTGYQALLTRIERLEAALRRGALPAPRPEEPVLSGEAKATPAPLPASPPKAPEISPSEPPPLPDEPLPVPAETPVAFLRQETKPAAKPAHAQEAQPFRPWPQVIDQLSSFNSSIAGMLRGTKAYFDGRRILIDVSNPVVLEMLKGNDYTRQQIKHAISEVTGQNYGIGPYRPPVEAKDEADPLEQLISSLPPAENITIER